MNTNDSILVQLTKEVTYGPQRDKATSVTVRCPSYETAGERKYRRILKAMVAKIISDEQSSSTREFTPEEVVAAKQKISSGELEFTPSEILITVASALGEKGFPDAVEQFCTHAHECCFLNNTEPLRSGVITHMDPDDIDILFATFIANFIMPSLLRGSNGNN